MPNKSEHGCGIGDNSMQNCTCPLCAKPVAESQYPRHRLILADESDADPNQQAESRLCPDCWTALQTLIA